MQRISKLIMFAASLSIAAGVCAQAPAGAPAGSTGLCRDGSYYSGPEKKGACRGHKSVKDWYGAAGSGAAAAAPSAPAAATAAAPAAAPAAPAAAAAATASAASAAKQRWTPPAAAAPGGGTGQVWVNSHSKVYHCQNDKWYGKTAHGEYMTEAAAKAAGNRPDHGKPCQ